MSKIKQIYTFVLDLCLFTGRFSPVTDTINPAVIIAGLIAVQGCTAADDPVGVSQRNASRFTHLCQYFADDGQIDREDLFVRRVNKANEVADSGWANGVMIVEIATLPNERKVLLSLKSVNPEIVEAAIAFPDNFNPQQRYPLLITQVTADRYLPNIDNMEAYRETALKNGYVVLTAQAKPWPATTHDDTRQHRYISLRAGLRWLRRQYPASRNWPLVLAGFSGGAKMIQPLAAVMLMEQREVIGLFLGGCNAESTKEILTVYPEVADAYKNIPIFLSSGRNDRIATSGAMRRVAKRMEKAGIKKVHLSRYSGAHYLDTGELDAALKWFLQTESPVH